MTEYVKRFTERAADVPVQLRRRLAIIRSLDEQIASTQKEIEEQIKRSITDKGRGSAKRQKTQHAEQQHPLAFDIHHAVQRISNLAEEKVRLGILFQISQLNSLNDVTVHEWHGVCAGVFDIQAKLLLYAFFGPTHLQYILVLPLHEGQHSQPGIHVH